MYAIQNKQYNLSQIVMVEWVEELVEANDPRTGDPALWYAFNLHLPNGNIEAMLHPTEEERKTEWERLIDTMEQAGL